MEKQPLQLSSFVARDPSLLTTESKDGVTMMGDADNAVYHLDAVGLQIWNLLEQPRSVSSLCEVLQEEFQVDAETCQRDVLGFLEQLREKGLIQMLPTAPTG